MTFRVDINGVLFLCDKLCVTDKKICISNGFLMWSYKFFIDMFCNFGLDINWFKKHLKGTGSNEQANGGPLWALLWVYMKSCVKDILKKKIFTG